MIPFLSELPASPVPAPSLPLRSAPGGRAGLDFAGLLNTALPAEVVMEPETALPQPDLAAAPAADIAAPAPDTFAVPLAPLLAGMAPQSVPPHQTMPPGTMMPNDGKTVPRPGADVPPAAMPVPSDIAAAATASVTEPSGPEHAVAAPARQDGVDVTETLAPEALMLTAASLPHVAAQIAAPPIQATMAPPALPVALAPIRPGAAPRIPAAAVEAVAEDLPAGPVPAPLPSDTPEAGLQPATSSAPASPAPQSATALAPAAPVAAPAPAAERAEPRPPVTQIESTIAQVGEIREALRTARPEMTMRHTEFGMVSLRLEAAGPAQDWRAVLTSRDPGFVPAVQAALAERQIGAAADTASTGSGTGQGGASEQRYGFSQGSGQGSSQPYMEHSGKRDEGASQPQRGRQSGAEEPDTAGTAENDRARHRDGGLFA